MIIIKPPYLDLLKFHRCLIESDRHRIVTKSRRWVRCHSRGAAKSGAQTANASRKGRWRVRRVEFDVQGRMPFFKSLTSPEELAEERTKFYVSVTRGRGEVHIYYSGFIGWSTGTIRQDVPSMFLYEIGRLAKG
jgi:superfamily I DNA/RNA helicase